MVSFVLEELKEVLMHSGLYVADRAVQYSIPQSNYHFYIMLERYNTETCTFFIPIREMGFALHEMYEVSVLVMGDIPHENTFPTQRNCSY